MPLLVSGQDFNGLDIFTPVSKLHKIPAAVSMCNKDMFHNKVNLVSPGSPLHSLALQCRIMA